MARRQTYIYEVSIGRRGVTILKEMVYARNSERAIALCKEKYRTEKYDWYRTKKRGLSKDLRADGFFTSRETEQIKSQPEAEAYAERKTEPEINPIIENGTFVPVEASVE